MVISLANPFQDYMMLQQQLPVRIWGSAMPGQEICIAIQESSTCTTADKDGRWLVELPPMKASHKETLTVSGGAEHIVIQNVAIGEVFIAGGQSNMEFCMRYERHVCDARMTCEDTDIRFYDLPKLCYDKQEQDYDYSRVGIWRKATAKDLDYFSAVGYYFARKLKRDLGVPVGIIGCNYGGTISAAWMSKASAFAVQPEYAKLFYDNLAGLSYDDYICSMRGKPLLDTGNSKWSTFYDFVLPRTPTSEEYIATFAQEPPHPDDFSLPLVPPHCPGSLYQNMVLRIAPFTVRGVLWYQGENDDSIQGLQYRYTKALTALMQDWRIAWQETTLPFFVVQLPGFDHWMGFRSLDFPTLRKCQQEAVDNDAHAWLCSISDLGEEFDIHPKDKLHVGERLALLAERHIFGFQVEADPPRLCSACRKGEKVMLYFENGKGLHVEGSTLPALEVIQGGVTIPYDFEIENNCLIIRCEKYACPDCVKFARTAWFLVNLYNKAGLPAIPFEMHFN